MQPDLWSLYALMYRSRKFEEAVRRIWKEGWISGEMHLGMGEEAIAAGIVSQLREGDAMALDHRGTPPMLMRGVDPVAMLREFMGKPDGLCCGQGGHMHMFAPDKLAASSGIVGAAGPAAAGFALAAQMLRPGTVSVAFFGEGAMNAGMLMEAMNLAAVWKLPSVFVCKDNSLAITTRAGAATAGNPLMRAHAFGMKASEVDGTDVLAVHTAAAEALAYARAGSGPAFLWAHCAHLEGHFLGDSLLDSARRPLYSFRIRFLPLLGSLFQPGTTSWHEKIASVRQILELASEVQRQAGPRGDPLVRARHTLARRNARRLAEMEAGIQREIRAIVADAFAAERSAA
ncbi:MAG: thiamine pyrophosphate-dependent enzyme [Bacteroidota bacterium]